MENLNYKFGVEIEFKLPESERGARNYGLTQIARKLAAAGIQAAFEGYNHTTRRHWKIVTDASVHGGGEVVSPILTHEDFGQIETVCQVLKEAGCSVDVECGLHVHHDAEGMTRDQIKMLAKVYTKYEPAIDSIMPRSRRANNSRWCRSIRRHDELAANFADIDAYNGPIAQMYGTRYTKLNLTALAVHGTVEFRQHSGTIEAEKIINWVKLTRWMMFRAVRSNRLTKSGDGDFAQMLRFIWKDFPVRRFYIARREHFAGRA